MTPAQTTKGRNEMAEKSDEMSPAAKMFVTTAFNDGMRELIASVHHFMPAESVVINTIACLWIARKQLGFTDEETRNEIVNAVNKNAVWSVEFGRKT